MHQSGLQMPSAFEKLRLPIIGAPLFIISTPSLVIEQCKAGIVGVLPALNARPAAQLEAWLIEIKEALKAHDQTHPHRPSAPFGVNLIVHQSNDRLKEDLLVCVKHQVPLVVTSLGAKVEVNEHIHSYGGVVMHDVINNSFAMKAIEKGADGLIAVAAGAGGHAGVKSPFALVQEIRAWFKGPLALSGAIGSGQAVLAALALGADFAYMGSLFIATQEARASQAYKDCVVQSSSDDIVYSNLFTGVHGNYLQQSIVNAGLDPQNLAQSDPSKMSFSSDSVKAWRDIWGCGQGISSVKEVLPTRALVDRLALEYQEALSRLAQLNRT
jgi:nitronate monooxygenase